MGVVEGKWDAKKTLETKEAWYKKSRRWFFVFFWGGGKNYPQKLHLFLMTLLFFLLHFLQNSLKVCKNYSLCKSRILSLAPLWNKFKCALYSPRSPIQVGMKYLANPPRRSKISAPRHKIISGCFSGQTIKVRVTPLIFVIFFASFFSFD